MGSWSVYCGISNISITAGDKCVLLPLKKNRNGEYLPYLPFTLPIFGEYDDYGGLENIEEDANTKLLETHFGVPIHDFAQFFTRGCVRDDEDDFPAQLKEVEELKDVTFMFINREVYDFMSTYTHLGYGGAGDLDFGNPTILKLLGFTYVGNDPNNPSKYDPKRFDEVWEFQGKHFYSDGTWLQSAEDSIHTLNGSYSALSSHVTIPEEVMWLDKIAMWQLWEHFDTRKQKEMLAWIIGRDRYSLGIGGGDFDDLFDKLVAEGLLNSPDLNISKLLEENKSKKNPKILKLTDKYLLDMPAFGKLMCDLVTIRRNMHCMSGHFTPYVLYLTPQCGEHRQHQVLLDKFAAINKGLIGEDEEE